jgi:hypothetical protein
MPNYRRANLKGGTFFFTVALARETMGFAALYPSYAARRANHFFELVFADLGLVQPQREKYLSFVFPKYVV